MRFRYLLAVLSFLFALAPAAAEPVVHAHPALWHVKGPDGEVYLLGSIHLLPKNIKWRTGAINAAISRANVFVFEVSTDEKAQAEIHELDRQVARCRPANRLGRLLPPNVRPDFDTAIESAHLSPDLVDHEQPWLVSLQLLIADGTAKHYSPDAGVDHAVMSVAAKAHKPMRFFRDHRATAPSSGGQRR